MDSRKRALASKLNRTEYPEIHKLSGSLSRSLYVLKLMREKGEDGLTPPEISFILTEVFRIKTRQEAVSVALKDALQYVDRKSAVVGTTAAFVYKLMKAGEDYLEERLKESKNQKS